MPTPAETGMKKAVRLVVATARLLCLYLGLAALVLAAWPNRAMELASAVVQMPPEPLHPWTALTLQAGLLAAGSVLIIACLPRGHKTALGVALAAAAVLLPSLVSVRIDQLNAPTEIVTAEEEERVVGVLTVGLIVSALTMLFVSLRNGGWPQHFIGFVLTVGVIGSGLALWRESTATPTDLVPVPRSQIRLSGVNALWPQDPAIDDHIVMIFVVPKRSDEGNVVGHETSRILGRLREFAPGCREMCAIQVEITRGEKDAKLMEALRLQASSPQVFVTLP